MAIGPRLELRTSQTLVLSPQLQTAIRLLALSNVELAAELASEIERNPLIETVEADEPTEMSPDARPSEPASAADAEIMEARGASDWEVDDEPATFRDDPAGDWAGETDGEERSWIDQVAASEESLAAALVRQAEAALQGPDLGIALAIVGAIDEAGYLTEPLAEIAARLGVDEAEVERVLRIVQTFEPTGVGARTLAECIRIQARERDRLDPAMEALIDHLDLVARGEVEKLKRICGVDGEDLADMLRELRSYDPKPGLKVGGGTANTVVPDILVRRTAKGLVVELNAATLPRIIVNQQYQARIARPARQRHDAAERRFLTQCLHQAQWLVRALDQRAQTILKVATEIVAQQAGFFDHGILHLKPLTMRAVAEAVGVHESTVSRVVANKSLACDRGTFDLRFFFSAPVPAGDGEEAAIAAVKARLRALIDSEPPDRPHSDDKLVELLKAEGFTLARRTVAKYREAMNIPSSYDRRRRHLLGSV
ncbi:MAG: RNA polymerase factor sigma-54 [Sphingomonadaceae bacterium]|uniref:RNA polymerase factor sigma-54 n=1 Tax=Thermaurantiacus sp. TaxID=2820283 RepID=UPI00298F136C|nr:RNA polymerase factor sigma-54 [Thermaurantiacus sp.]MCS6987209.1 RNA polymerase factor sigma-54 [Sphingomonadaceae bacterium]MDW8414429.1 RNA polymerase factor sigma-54 [Thermaurantiacus sp.]